ncbi:hypothetical protein ACFL1S_00895 [Pseudomonadota bacterium]
MKFQQDETSIDLSFRPDSYWPESPDREILLSRIQGKTRRDIARRKLEEEGVAGLGAFLGREELADFEREAWGGIHPQFMGGEYLLAAGDDDVEIARISLKSTTGDQISIRARREGNNIRYNVVDEYEIDYIPAFEESERPLALGELVDFLDGTEMAEHDYEAGLIQIYWEDPFGSYGSVEERIDFVSVESGFYPELSEYYEELGKAWMKRQHDEDEET